MTAAQAARFLTPVTALIAVLTLAGGALRFLHLGTKSLWYDEAVIYHVVQGGWRDILTQNALENSAPPLYALLLGLLTGPDASEAWLRSLSALAGTAAIPLVYLLSREFLMARVAWVAPLLLAASPTQLVYSQQLREYSLTTAVAAFMLLAFARFVREPDGRRAILVASASVLGLLTQYGLGLMLAALNLVCLGGLLYSKRPMASYRRWFFSQLPALAVAVLLYLTVVRHQLPVVNEAGLGYLRPYYWHGESLWTFLTSPPQNIIAFALPGWPALLLWAVGILAFLAAAGTGLATALFVVPTALAVTAAMAGLYPYGAIRQDIFLTPMVYVCAAIGAERVLSLLPRRLPAAVPASALVVLSVALAAPAVGAGLAFVSQTPGYQPMRIVVAALEEQLYADRTRPIYVYYNAIPAFRYYWRGRSEPWIRGAFHRSFMDEEKSKQQMLAIQDEIRALAAQGEPFWVVLSHIATAEESWFLEILNRSGAVEMVEGGSNSSLLLVTPIGGHARSG